MATRVKLRDAAEAEKYLLEMVSVLLLTMWSNHLGSGYFAERNFQREGPAWNLSVSRIR